MADNIERWVRVGDEGVQIAVLDASLDRVLVGPATMALLRGEGQDLINSQYPDHDGLFLLVANEEEGNMWYVNRPIIIELLQDIGFVRLQDEMI